MDLDMTLAALRVFAGLVIAGHGAQKALAMFGGPGLTGWTKGVQQMGFAPAPLWAGVAAWGELIGGLMLAAGLLTGIAAGVLLLDMIVAIWKVHWAKGFWITNGGMEYALMNAVVFGLFGIAGAGALSLDGALGLRGWTTALFGATLVIGLLGVWASTRPRLAVARFDERGQRRAA